MAHVEIYRSCERCNGTGGIPQNPLEGSGSIVQCPACVGSGKILFATSDDIYDMLEILETKVDTVADKVDDVIDKCNDILEKLDT